MYQKKKSKINNTEINENKTNINWYITTYDKTPSIPYLIRNFC